MIRKSLLAVVILALLLSAALAVTQESQGPRLEITGLNPVDLPTVVVSVNVFDEVGQPVGDLTAADFTVVGELADRARVVSVRSFSDQAIPISVVLAVDTSSSMEGMPIESARAAATAFVESIGPNDPVAIVTFSTGARVVQEFITDRATLTNVINSLRIGGETYLFDGALEAVDTAVASDNSRRAVILLSDGAQYDTTGGSDATQEDVFNRAVQNGVPVYTIGLGFGADRHYLENLAENTNALFYESPTPAELEAIYSELANLLRTQYEVVLEVDVPADGTTYELGLSVTTPEGTAQATGSLRAPVPVPFIRLPELPTLIDSLTEVEAEVVADDALTGVEILLDGTSHGTLTEAPYLYVIDPVALTPGGHTLTFTATDEDGDVGTVTADFTVAALPSTIAINPPLEGEIAEVQTFTLDITGQTAPVSVSYTIDGGDPVELTEPYSITIDPYTLTPGDHFAGITVSNAGGVTTSTVSQFSIPELPIVFNVSGFESGTEIRDRVEVSVEVASSQSPVTSITFDVNGTPLEVSENTAVLEAVNLPPGPATLNITVTNELGQTTTSSIDLTIAALPPTVTLGGLELGETLSEPREIQISTGGQTAITDILVQIDGAAIEVTPGEPATALLDILTLTPGTHILAVIVTNEGRQTTRVEVPFTVVEEPFLTLTVPATPTETDTEVAPTETPSEAAPTEAVTPTEEVTPTTEADAQAAASATAERIDQAATSAIGGLIQLITQTAEAREQQPTATETATEEATVDTQATENLIATANAQATTDAASTSAAVVPTDEPTATPDTAGTAAAQAAEQSTADAAASATQSALDEQATAAAETAVAQAALDEQATSDAEATANAQATQTAETEAAQLAANEQATADALATENAAETQAAADEQATADAEASASAEPTATEEATSEVEPTEEVGVDDGTPVEEGTIVAQGVDDASATPTPGDEESTPVPTITPIGTLIPAQAESAPSDQTLTPIAVIVVIIFVLLLLIYFFLSRARRRTR